jgi:hypothetical protein
VRGQSVCTINRVTLLLYFNLISPLLFKVQMAVWFFDTVMSHSLICTTCFLYTQLSGTSIKLVHSILLFSAAFMKTEIKISNLKLKMVTKIQVFISCRLKKSVHIVVWRPWRLQAQFCHVFFLCLLDVVFVVGE